MSKVLIDTNILVYAIDEDSMYYQRARKLLDNESFHFFSSSKNLIEFLAVTTRSKGYNLECEIALEVIEEIIQGFDILYPSRESLAIFLDLLNKYNPKGLLVHDYEIISIGLANGVSEIATFNIKDFRSVSEISVIEI